MSVTKNVDIIEAAIENNIELLTQLLIKGNNPNFVEDVAGVTPLHYAATHGSYEAALLLLTAGATIKKEILLGETPIQSALNKKHERLYKLLVKVSSVSSGSIH
jgi:ankyrin repeat protein